MAHIMEIKFVEVEFQGGNTVARVSHVYSNRFDRTLVVIQTEEFMQVATTNIFNGCYMNDMYDIVEPTHYEMDTDNISKDILSTYQLEEPINCDDLQVIQEFDEIEELLDIAKFAQVPQNVIGLADYRRT